MLVVIPSRNEERVNEVVKTTRWLFPESDIVVGHDPAGNGKGWAIHHALNQSEISYPLIFIDRDMDIHPFQIIKLLNKSKNYDIVVGKKEIPKGVRGLITRLSRLYIRVMFGIKVDTQTGVKLFNYTPEWTTKGWACDIEILYKAKKLGKTMTEVGVEAQVSKPKTIKDLWITLVESFRILVS